MAVDPNNGPSRDSPRALAELQHRQLTTTIGIDPRSLMLAESKLATSMAVGYRPLLPIYSIRGSEILGWAFFADVEVMRLHACIRLPLNYVLGPQQYAEWTITASSYAVARFAAEQLQWFWLNAMPDILCEGYTYGWSAAELEYAERDGLLVFSKATTFSPRDVMPLVIQHGKRKGTPVGVQVTNLAQARCALWGWRKDVPNKAFWYAHRPRGGLRFGESQIRPAWRFWRMLAGIDGVEEIQAIAAHRLGTGIVEVTHPNEMVTAQNSGLPGYASGDQVHTRDIARFMAANLKAGAGIVMSSENWPQENGGGRKWGVEAKPFQTNLGDLGAYDDKLSKKSSEAIEVPQELFQAAQTGSGYSGRAIPLQGFLVGQQTNLQRSTVQVKQQALDPLINWNFGPKAWFDLIPKPLTESVRKSSWETPGDPQAMAQGAPAMSQGVDLPQEPGQ